MRIKILTHIGMGQIGTMSDLKQNEIIAIDDDIAEKLIEEGKAELIL